MDGAPGPPGRGARPAHASERRPGRRRRGDARALARVALRSVAPALVRGDLGPGGLHGREARPRRAGVQPRRAPRGRPLARAARPGGRVALDLGRDRADRRLLLRRRRAGRAGLQPGRGARGRAGRPAARPGRRRAGRAVAGGGRPGPVAGRALDRPGHRGARPRRGVDPAPADVAAGPRRGDRVGGAARRRRGVRPGAGHRGAATRGDGGGRRRVARAYRIVGVALGARPGPARRAPRELHRRGAGGRRGDRAARRRGVAHRWRRPALLAALARPGRRPAHGRGARPRGRGQVPGRAPHPPDRPGHPVPRPPRSLSRPRPDRARGGDRRALDGEARGRRSARRGAGRAPRRDRRARNAGDQPRPGRGAPPGRSHADRARAGAVPRRRARGFTRGGGRPGPVRERQLAGRPPRLRRAPRPVHRRRRGGGRGGPDRPARQRPRRRSGQGRPPRLAHVVHAAPGRGHPAALGRHLVRLPQPLPVPQPRGGRALGGGRGNRPPHRRAGDDHRDRRAGRRDADRVDARAQPSGRRRSATTASARAPRVASTLITARVR